MFCSNNNNKILRICNTRITETKLIILGHEFDKRELLAIFLIIYPNLLEDVRLLSMAIIRSEKIIIKLDIIDVKHMATVFISEILKLITKGKRAENVKQ